MGKPRVIYVVQTRIPAFLRARNVGTARKLEDFRKAFGNAQNANANPATTTVTSVRATVLRSVPNVADGTT